VDCGPRWNFIHDMNRDGVYSASDLWLQIKWLFLAPGDGVVCLVAQAPGFGGFLHAGYGSFVSIALSCVAWILLLYLLASVLLATSRV
jgi:hypothetical protein